MERFNDSGEVTRPWLFALLIAAQNRICVVYASLCPFVEHGSSNPKVVHGHAYSGDDVLLVMMTTCWLCKLIATAQRVVILMTELGWWPTPIAAFVRVGGW